MPSVKLTYVTKYKAVSRMFQGGGGKLKKKSSMCSGNTAGLQNVFPFTNRTIVFQTLTCVLFTVEGGSFIGRDKMEINVFCI
jgi:hypothetical protein